MGAKYFEPSRSSFLIDKIIYLTFILKSTIFEYMKLGGFMNRKKCRGILLLLFVMMISAMSALITVQGTVTGGDSPLPNVDVYFYNNVDWETQTCTTNEFGVFSITMIPGYYYYSVIVSGYQNFYADDPINMTTDNETYPWLSFVLTPAAPHIEPPIITSPDYGAINVSLSPTLQWTYDQDYTASIKVFLSTSMTFDSPIYNGVPKTSHNLNGLTQGKIYYWKVVEINSLGAEIESYVSSFYTEGAGVAPAVVRSSVNPAFKRYNTGSEFKSEFYIFGGEYKDILSANLGITSINKESLISEWFYQFGSSRDDLAGGVLASNDGQIYISGTYDKQASYNNKPMALNKIIYYNQNDFYNWATPREYYVENSMLNYNCGVARGFASYLTLAGWDGDNIVTVSTLSDGTILHENTISGDNPNDELYPNKLVSCPNSNFVVGQYNSSPYLLKLNPITASRSTDKVFTEAPFNQSGSFYDMVQYNSYYYIVGSYYDGISTDMILVKMTFNFNIVWTRSLGGGGTEIGKAIAIDNDKIYVVGESNSYSGSMDLIIASFNLDGDLLWQELLDNDETEMVNGCFINSNGNLIVYGQKGDFLQAQASLYEFDQVSLPAPTSPILVGPIQAVDSISLFANLKWSYTGATPIAGFKLYLGTDNPPTNMIDGLILSNGTNSYQSPLLTPNTQYYWRVIPFTANDETPRSHPIWTFTSEQTVEASQVYTPGTPLTLVPPVISGIQPNISINPSNLVQAANVSVVLGSVIPENLLVPENVLPIWLQLISDVNVFPATLEFTFLGLDYSGGIPEILVSNGSTWSNLGITNIELLELNPFHVRFTYNPVSKNTNAYFAFSSGGNATLPVTLSSFNAVNIENNCVNIKWTTESETNMSGYHLYRSKDNNVSQAIRITNQLIPACNSCVQNNYSIKDIEIEQNNTYYYWLSSYGSDGSSTQYGPVSVKINNNNETPEVFTQNILKQSYPNPFKNTTAISYSISGSKNSSVPTEISIFNIKGQKVKSLITGNHSSGKDFSVTWDGTNQNGQKVQAGIYFYKIITPEFSDIKKMILIK